MSLIPHVKQAGSIELSLRRYLTLCSVVFGNMEQDEISKLKFVTLMFGHKA
jgi:hypothetical protein